MTNGKMQTLYAHLTEAGLSKSYITKNVLPGWWSDDIAESPAGYLEAISYIAKHLGIPLSSLRNTDGSLTPQNAASARFKLREGVNEDDVTWARAIAIRAAEIAASGMEQPYASSPPVDATSVRSHILEAGRPWVGLTHLVDFCWNAGIPILHLPDVPGNKMDGMAVRVNGRPAIVLSLNKQHEAWLLFILAHELGHILRGHLDKDEAWVDEKFDPVATNVHEQEANSFAVELITGDPETQVSGRYPKAPELAERAVEIGNEYRIDPGAVILNFAYHDSGNVWPLANAALKSLGAESSAPSLILERAGHHLKWELLPKESADFLRRLMGVESEDQDLKSTSAPS